MSWPAWPSGGSAVPSTMLPINSAPTVMPSGMQYTPEQWAQMQQQNWQQWAQWQQQYQQWHQQYGAEYQKSLAMTGVTLPAATSTSIPSMDVPPPLPITETKPPLPPEEPQFKQMTGNSALNPKSQFGTWNQNQMQLQSHIRAPSISQSQPSQNQFSLQNQPNQTQFGELKLNQASSNRQSQFNQNQNSSQVSNLAPQSNRQLTQNQYNQPRLNQNQFNQNQNLNQFSTNQNNFNPNQKQIANRNTNMPNVQSQISELKQNTINSVGPVKRPMVGMDFDFNKRLMTEKPNWGQDKNNWQEGFNSKAPQNPSSSASSTKTNEDDRFEKDFAAWEASFKKWKEQNANHPDKEQYREYERKWESWRTSFLERREQMKKKMGQAKLNETVSSTPAKTALLPTPSTNAEVSTTEFLSSNSASGIPGLDLVKDDDEVQKGPEIINLEDGEEAAKAPNLEVLSKNINMILSDQKLMDILSKVSQKPVESAQSEIVSTQSPQISAPLSNVQGFHDLSSQSFEEKSNQDTEYYNQREAVHNFDDQTRSSFTLGPNDHDQRMEVNQRKEINLRSNIGPYCDVNRKNSFEFRDQGRTEKTERFQSDGFGGQGFGERNFDNIKNDSYGLRGDQARNERDVGGFRKNDFESRSYRENYEVDERRRDFYENNEYDEETDYDKYHEWFNEDERSEQGVPFQDHSRGPADEDLPLFEPATVIDYAHKPLQKDELDVILEPIYTFDYRHKPLNRIPLAQRPEWLDKSLRSIPEFDPLSTRPAYIPHIRYPARPSLNHRNAYPEPIERGFYKRDDYSKSQETFLKKKRISPPRRNLREDLNQLSNDFEELSDEDMNWNDQDVEQDSSRSHHPQDQQIKGQQSVVMIEDLINAPGRYKRAPKIVIILRGPPGSGKTFLAKLIKDKEVENGGSAPRILSLDDYFMVEQEKEIVEDGKPVRVKEMVYEYEKEMEESYRSSLLKSFKKTITDGYFNFIIVDNINDKVKYFGEMWSFAKQNGFQVYICQLDLDPQVCVKRNIHGRTEKEIEDCVAGWDPTPSHHPILDASGLLQAGVIAEVEMEEVQQGESEKDQDDESIEDQVRSKWDNFDCSSNNLAKLDGVSKPLRHRTMEEYLQLDDEWINTKPTKPGQKRVRWADLEEQKEQAKMRAIGFVVGQTNWNRMMDPSQGSSALTQTKYIERVGRHSFHS